MEIKVSIKLDHLNPLYLIENYFIIVIIHKCSSRCNSSNYPFISIIITIIITSLFLLFLYQLEEHVTYLACEVELKKGKKRKTKYGIIYPVHAPACLPLV